MSDENEKYGFGYGSQLSGGVQYDNQPSTPVEVNTSAMNTQTSAHHHTADPVRDITTAEFMPLVIEGSKTRPVLVDFWAPWCGPCKQLAPALEAVVAKTNGAVQLVKMNIDEHPEIAGQMGIQSIPAVVAFVNGQPKDAFMGAKSEREIEQFIEKIAGPVAPSPVEEAIERAQSLMKDESWEEAAHIFSEIIRHEPQYVDALAGFGMCALNLGHLEQAKQALESAGDAKGNQAIDALRTAIELKEQADKVGDLSQLTEAVEKDPANHPARFDLAIALNGAGQREEAARHLLKIIELDRNWNEQAARNQLLQFFEAWGPMADETLSARRQLSSLLFS